MLEKLSGELETVIIAMKGNLLFSLKIIGVLWAIHLINFMARYGLNVLGVHTRKLRGLPGIVFSPMLHADFNHIFFNTVPLFVLSDLVLLSGRPVFYSVTVTIVILSGVILWIFGQPGIHVGASGLIMGYFGYLLSEAYFQVTGTTVIVAGVCIYYFGGLLLSIFPGAKKNVSWDGHIFGLLSGIFSSYYLPQILKINEFWTKFLI